MRFSSQLLRRPRRDRIGSDLHDPTRGATGRRGFLTWCPTTATQTIMFSPASGASRSPEAVEAVAAGRRRRPLTSRGVSSSDRARAREERRPARNLVKEDRTDHEIQIPNCTNLDAMAHPATYKDQPVHES